MQLPEGPAFLCKPFLLQYKTKTAEGDEFFKLSLSELVFSKFWWDFFGTQTETPGGIPASTTRPDWYNQGHPFRGRVGSANDIYEFHEKTYDISSGTGAYLTIKGTDLQYTEADGTISIGGIAKY